MGELTREQAGAFLSTLWPCGSMSYLDNPTRTFLAALIGRVPQSFAWSPDDEDTRKLRQIADILRQVAAHFDASNMEAQGGSRWTTAGSPRSRT